MRMSKILIVLGLINLGVWMFKVVNYFFDFHVSDETGLAICFLSVWYVSYKFRKGQGLAQWVLPGTIVLATLIQFPVFSIVLQKTDYAWLMPNLLAGLLGLVLGLTKIASVGFSSPFVTQPGRVVYPLLL